MDTYIIISPLQQATFGDLGWRGDNEEVRIMNAVKFAVPKARFSGVEVSPHTTNRAVFFKENWDKTKKAYKNDDDNLWFKEAAKERILYCTHLNCAYIEGEVAGYIGFDSFELPRLGSVAYIEIATCYEEFQKNGVVTALLSELITPKYNAFMLRTQNPNMVDAFYRAYGACEPLECAPSDHAKQFAAIIGEQSPGYEYETMVSRGVYAGQCLTGEVIHGRTWFEEALYSRINPEKGDAQIIVANSPLAPWHSPRRAGF